MANAETCSCYNHLNELSKRCFFALNIIRIIFVLPAIIRCVIQYHRIQPETDTQNILVGNNLCPERLGVTESVVKISIRIPN